MIPAVLEEVVEYLREQNITLPIDFQEGRLNSALAEDQIIDILRQAEQWKIYSPNQETDNNRAWYDVKINDLFCDIKVSNCNANDNTQAKKAIYYLLTGDENTGNVPNQDKIFFKMMRENENMDKDRDYYYLIVNKMDTEDVFVVNLKGIVSCNSAPNNPPFQVNWGRNRELADRSWEEAKKFLLSMWAESVKELIALRSRGMPKYYPEFFEGDKHE